MLVQHVSKRSRQDEFKGESAERIKIREHRRVLQNSLGSSFLNYSVLDVGCGGGLIATSLAAQGFNVTAIDALQSNIDIAANYAKEHNIKVNYLKSPIEELESDAQYDVVICLEVIEHVDNVQQFLINLVERVKPGGIAIISTINRTKKAYLLGIIAAEHILRWVPKNTHDYSKFLKPSEIYDMLKDTDIEIKELKGLVYNLAKSEWQLSDNIDVNYFIYLERIPNRHCEERSDVAIS